jgi:hypothetical protein
MDDDDVPFVANPGTAFRRMKRWDEMDGTERFGMVAGWLLAALILGAMLAVAGLAWWLAVVIWQAALHA